MLYQRSVIQHHCNPVSTIIEIFKKNNNRYETAHILKKTFSKLGINVGTNMNKKYRHRGY